MINLCVRVALTKVLKCVSEIDQIANFVSAISIIAMLLLLKWTSAEGLNEMLIKNYYKYFNIKMKIDLYRKRCNLLY